MKVPRLTLWVVYFALLIIVSSQAFALKNALNQVEPFYLTNRISGVNAKINYTGPHLNGGTWSYHRVAVSKRPYNYYVEIGYWYHKTSGYQGFWVLHNSLGFFDGDVGFTLLPTTHRFRITNQYYSNNWTIKVDSTDVYTVFQDFKYGDHNIAGGEVCNGDCTPPIPPVDEHMGNTTYTNLKWRECLSNCNLSTATYAWRLWDSNVYYWEDAPFAVTVNSNTSISVNP